MKKNISKIEDESVATYSIISNFILSLTRYEENPDVADLAKIAWVIFNEARVFTIEPQQVKKIKENFQKSILNKLNITKEELVKYREVEPDQDMLALLTDIYNDEIFNIEVFNKLPFKSTLLIFDNLSHEDFDYSENHYIAELIGSYNGKKYSFTIYQDLDNSLQLSLNVLFDPVEDNLSIIDTDEEDEFTSSSLYLSNAIVEIINSNKAYYVERPLTFGQKLFIKQKSIRKSELKLPKPFYAIHLDDEIIQKHFSSNIKKNIEWAHRWDVRGHECVRIVRGKLPLLPKIKKSLLSREYRIYTDDNIPESDINLLKSRSCLMRDKDEWIAIMNYWRDNYVKGPVNKPYIPALRIVSK